MHGGGRLVWTSVPALRYEDGSDCAARFLNLFGLKHVAEPDKPLKLADREIAFEGVLAGLAPMKVLTDYLPDYAYPLEADEAQIVARCGKYALGSWVRRGAGQCLYLAFRPRDDQSCSMGRDVSTLFDALQAIGAYAPDSLEAMSRPAHARYIANCFPNGAVSLACHYRTFYENWPGLFYRDEEEDALCLKGRELPSIAIDLRDASLEGHKVTFHGEDALTYLYQNDSLQGYSGRAACEITIDGKTWRFADEPVDLSFAIVDKARLAEGIEAALLIRCDRPAELTIPCDFTPNSGAACALDFFNATMPVEWRYGDGVVFVTVTEEMAGKWIAVSAR